MRQESLQVGIGPARQARARTRLIALLAAVEAHLMQAVNQLADSPSFMYFIARSAVGVKIVVQVAAQVDLLLGRLCHHLARLEDVVRDRLLDQNVLPGLQRLHHRLEVPATVLEPARGHVHDVEFLVPQHFGQAVVRLHTVLRRRGVSPRLHHVAGRDQVGERVVLVTRGMLVADPAQTDHTDFESHEISFLWITSRRQSSLNPGTRSPPAALSARRDRRRRSHRSPPAWRLL